MLELNKRIRERMEAVEALDAMNELRGGSTNPGKGMRECLKLLMSHAGVNHKSARVYKAREGRIGKRMCYVFAFVCDGRKYEGFVDKLTGEILKYRFQLA